MVTYRTTPRTLPEGLDRYVGKPAPRNGVSYDLAGVRVCIPGGLSDRVGVLRRAQEYGGTAITLHTNGRTWEVA